MFDTDGLWLVVPAFDQRKASYHSNRNQQKENVTALKQIQLKFTDVCERNGSSQMWSFSHFAYSLNAFINCFTLPAEGRPAHPKNVKFVIIKS